MFILLSNYLYDFSYFFSICKAFRAFKITFIENKTKPATKLYNRFFLDIRLSQRDLNLSNEANF